MVVWTLRDDTHEDVCQGLADELENHGFHIRRFKNSSVFSIMDKPWNEIDADIALCFMVHAQNDGYLLADHMNYSEDAKQTTLIPYDLPDMLDRIIEIIGKCPHMR